MTDIESFLYKTELSQLISISWAAFIVTLSIKYLPQGSCSNKSRYSGQLWARKKSRSSTNWKVSGSVPGYLSLQVNVSLGKIWPLIHRVCDCECDRLKSAQRYGINMPHESVCEHSLAHIMYSESRGRPEKSKINTSPSVDTHAEFRWNKICYINKFTLKLEWKTPMKTHIQYFLGQKWPHIQYSAKSLSHPLFHCNLLPRSEAFMQF